MQFVGLDALKERVPLGEIATNDEVFDLHNDGEMKELGYDFSARVFRLSWTLKEAARLKPMTPELGQRVAAASATLILSGVRSMSLAGLLADSLEPDAGGLDFMEYTRTAPGLGELRFVFSNDAEITITASRCELRLIRG